MKRLSGKVAIVTASTEGIGRAIARRLGQDGASVMISSRKQDNVEETVKQLQSEGLDVHGVVCHVGKKQHRENLVKQTVERFGGIDILVSNAAVSPFMGEFLDTTEEAWDKVFDVNLKAGFLLCKDVVPYMEKRGGGSVVFISSVAAYWTNEYIGAYSVSKTAMVGLVKALTPQLASMNIRVNAIAPGLIRTKLSSGLDKDVSMIPCGRVGEPEDCSGIVSFLVSDDAQYVYGETIVNAGGLPSRL